MILKACSFISVIWNKINHPSNAMPPTMTMWFANMCDTPLGQKTPSLPQNIRCRDSPPMMQFLLTTLKFYNCDYLDSLTTFELALRRSKHPVEMLVKGGFKLTRLASNCPARTAELNASELPRDKKQTKTISYILGTSSHELGLKWDDSSDSIVVSRGIIKNVPSTLTQRAVLSLVAAVFDPVGFVAPFTV